MLLVVDAVLDATLLDATLLDADEVAPPPPPAPVVESADPDAAPP